jgi:hypothetical protein
VLTPDGQAKLSLRVPGRPKNHKAHKPPDYTSKASEVRYEVGSFPKADPGEIGDYR